MGEQPIFTTKAHVFQIDPATKKKWLPVSASAINVSYYYDSTRNTYRIISVEGSKAVINSTITPNMTFTKTSVKFGQWTDSRANTVYGLGFGTEGDLTKFIEKFKEIKEMCRSSPGGTTKSPNTGSATTNGTSPVPDSNHSDPVTTTTTSSSLISQSHSPVSSPKMAVNSPADTSLSSESRNHSNSSLPNSQGVVEQLKYENDRLKIALAQSSANAKKWEIELQTLKNNNARLTTALQESTANVEEWKKQLALYKEESARIKKKFLESDKPGSTAGGSELLQRQLADMRDKVTELEKSGSHKQEEISHLHSRLEDSKSLESRIEHLTERIQTLERDKEALIKQTQSLKEQADGAHTATARDKQQLRLLQEQIGSKVSDLYGLSDKLAEMLH